MRKMLSICFGLLLVPMFATAQNAMPSVELPPALDRVLRDYESAWQAKDAKRLADLFTEDGFVLSNGKPPVRGRAAIRESYADGGGPLALRAFAWSVDETTGYIIGGYGARPGVEDWGKFILAIRYVDGR